jgi:hypothetical protein
MPDLNEAKTRAFLINPQLEKAGWNLSDRSQIQFEVPVTGYDPTPWNGFTDFCLPAGISTAYHTTPYRLLHPST